MSDIICRRCGQCCHYFIDGVKRVCKHLKRLPSGSFVCRIYPNRLGTLLDSYFDSDNVKKDIKCGLRVFNAYNYRGCPYNRREWGDFPD